MKSFPSIALSLALLSTGVTASASLINNGGFETDANANNVPDGWSENVADIESDYITGGTAGDDVHTGNAAVALLVPGTGASNRWFTPNNNLADLAAGVEYKFSAYVKTENLDADDSVVLTVSQLDGSASTVAESTSGEILGNSDWFLVEFTFVGDEDVDTGRVLLQFRNGSNGASNSGSKAIFDDISLTAVPEPGSLSLTAIAGALIFLRRSH